MHETHRLGLRAGCAIAVAGLGLAACGDVALQSAHIPALTTTQIVDRDKPGTVQVLANVRTGKIGGTAFMFDAKDDLFLTNEHVIAGASSIYARTSTGARFPLRVYAEDPCEDVAVLQAVGAVPSGLKALPLGDSGDLQPGQPATVLGFAGTLQHLSRTSLSATTGTISNSRVQGGTVVKSLPIYPQLIETDADINPGNSGGPLLDDRGEVIGMATLHNPGANGDTVSGQGFAIPSDRIRRLLAQLRAGHSQAAMGWSLTAYSELSVLDVMTQDRDYGRYGTNFAAAVERYMRHLGVHGVYVDDVSDGSAADKGGVIYGEVIEEIDGSPVRSVGDVCTAILSKSPGDSVSVTGRWLNAGTRIAQIGLPFYDRLKIPRS